MGALGLDDGSDQQRRTGPKAALPRDPLLVFCRSIEVDSNEVVFETETAGRVGRTANLGARLKFAGPMDNDECDADRGPGRGQGTRREQWSRLTIASENADEGKSEF